MTLLEAEKAKRGLELLEKLETMKVQRKDLENLRYVVVHGLPPYEKTLDLSSENILTIDLLSTYREEHEFHTISSYANNFHVEYLKFIDKKIYDLETSFNEF